MRITVLGLLATLLFSIPGCIVIPTKIGKDSIRSGPALDSSNLEFLLDPATTKQEVENHLGPPYLIWIDANVYAYHTIVQEGTAIVLWGVGPPAVGGAAGLELFEKYIFVIQFNESDKIVRLDCFECTNMKQYEDKLRECLSRPVRTQLVLPELIKEQ